MRGLTLPPAIGIWAILLGATLSSWLVAEDMGSLAAPYAATAVVLIAALKIRLVFVHFMELGRRVLPWRIVFEAWIGVVTTLILAAYWSGH
ncbi:hypothetical protein D3874_22415 [Oleomonas cavernae]|uniref:Cytochrome C oxidase subunit IV n=1 Tax=Oleomonas cavernae TaxID=2320859 RepID=A0A418WH73_9PROT|nr:cytochrome C oxidase subunit IV family protein [Oleomonas cavernae]RJF89386.1 hypothetical protein D3874_22415 [Oleomonas cavernae]